MSDGIPRGLDGLTTEELRVSRRSWWDQAFTDQLLAFVPRDCELMVDLGCGLATAAITLLPSLPKATYLGLDSDQHRLEGAAADLAVAGLSDRSSLIRGHGESIPADDESVHVVLTTMTLQHVGDVQAVLKEVSRVLRRAGVFVAAEPDNLGQRFYFDGNLEAVNAEFHRLCERYRSARMPADLAVGPRLPLLLRGSGFGDIRTEVHAVSVTRYETASACAERLRRAALTVAAAGNLPPESQEVAAVERAVNRSLSAYSPDHLGFSCHVVPVFVCAGVAQKAWRI